MTYRRRSLNGANLDSIVSRKACSPGFWRTSERRTYKTSRTFFDFVLGGLSLYELAAQRGDLVSVIGVDHPSSIEQARAIRRLLGREPGDASGKRVSLYVCPECGDLGCGAITARIDQTSEETVWQDFGYENNYEREVDRRGLSSLGPFILIVGRTRKRSRPYFRANQSREECRYPHRSPLR